MAINLVEKFSPAVDELFAAESKKSLLTNQNYDWSGAHTVKIYTVTTSSMNDYDRNPNSENLSRYGTVSDLAATTASYTLTKDRSFTFAIDKLDRNETGDALEAAAALARQQREVIIPEIDAYTYGVMASGAGTKPAAVVLTASNIYDEILKGSSVLDDNYVPEDGRVLVVSPEVYVLIKKSTDITKNGDVGAELRAKGVVGMLDGMKVVKVPASRLPAAFGFMIAHPVATVAPVKLEDYKVHEDPPGISGNLVEGRVCYDAFVLANKAKGIYYQAMAPAALTVTSAAGSASGKTALTVEPALGSGNEYKYKVGTAATAVTYHMTVSDGWTSWDGSADITAASGKILTLVEATSDHKAIKAGTATVTAAT